MEDIKKNQTQLLKIKTTTCTMKNTQDGNNNNVDITKEKKDKSELNIAV